VQRQRRLANCLWLKAQAEPGREQGAGPLLSMQHQEMFTDPVAGEGP
jgi:hypothetical protein